MRNPIYIEIPIKILMGVCFVPYVIYDLFMSYVLRMPTNVYGYREKKK